MATVKTRIMHGNPAPGTFRSATFRIPSLAENPDMSYLKIFADIPNPDRTDPAKRMKLTVEVKDDSGRFVPDPALALEWQGGDFVGRDGSSDPFIKVEGEKLEPLRGREIQLVTDVPVAISVGGSIEVG